MGDGKGNVYTSSDARTFYAIGSDGTVLWKYQSAFHTEQPFFVLDDVVFGSKESLFRLHGGALVWKFAANVMGYRSGPVFDGTGAIYFNDNTTLVAVDGAGKLLWKYGNAAPLALDQKGRLYVMGGPGLACLSD